MTPTYLIDTNHITAMYEKNAKVDTAVREARRRRESYATSVVSLGEIESGFQQSLAKAADLKKRDDFNHWATQHIKVNAVEVDRDVPEIYGELIAKIMRTNQRPKGKRTEAHLLELGVDQNDLWIASIAISRNLILVTDDAMIKIKAAARDDLRTENWMR